MHIGFTGARDRTTKVQLIALEALLKMFYTDDAVHSFHHGACIGADEEFHKIVEEVYTDRRDFSTWHLHPSTLPEFQGNFRTRFGKTVRNKPILPLERNKHIVDESDIMIAMPSGPEKLRSGTWATIRYAKKQNKRLYIIDPKGGMLIFNR